MDRRKPYLQLCFRTRNQSPVCRSDSAHGIFQRAIAPSIQTQFPCGMAAYSLQSAAFIHVKVKAKINGVRRNHCKWHLTAVHPATADISRKAARASRDDKTRHVCIPRSGLIGSPTLQSNLTKRRQNTWAWVIQDSRQDIGDSHVTHGLDTARKMDSISIPLFPICRRFLPALQKWKPASWVVTTSQPG